MPKRIRCRCGGKAACKLCLGKGKYEYAPGPMGWQPFPCPTCDGGRQSPAADALDGEHRCVTCADIRTVDPANPPSGGMWDDLCKILFGA